MRKYLYKFFAKKTYNIVGKNNKIIAVIDGVEHDYTNKRIPNLSIIIYGDNNTVYFSDINVFGGKGFIKIGGYPNKKINNSVIKFGKNQWQKYNDMFISIYDGDGGNKLTIGDNTYIGYKCQIIFSDTSTECNIGSDCMIGNDVLIHIGDGHSIIARETGNVINIPKSPVNIGDHCWVGARVMINKGASIPNDTIVAGGSIVTKHFASSYTLVGGNPANIIKENVNWDISVPSLYKK